MTSLRILNVVAQSMMSFTSVHSRQAYSSSKLHAILARYAKLYPDIIIDKDEKINVEYASVDKSVKYLPVNVLVVSNIKEPILEKTPTIVDGMLESMAYGTDYYIIIPKLFYETTDDKVVSSILRKVFFGIVDKFDTEMTYQGTKILKFYEMNTDIPVYDITIAYAALGYVYYILSNCCESPEQRLFNLFEEEEFSEKEKTSIVEVFDQFISNTTDDFKFAIAKGELFRLMLVRLTKNE